MSERAGRVRVPLTAGVSAAVCAAVFAALLTSAGCAGQSASGTPAARLSNSSASSPPLLAPADLPGAGWRLVPVEPGGPAPAWPWALSRCVLYRPADYPAQEHRESASRHGYVAGGGRSVVVIVERFAPGWATRSMDDVREVTLTCMRYEHSDANAEFLESHTLTLEGFAGDDSVLLETVRIPPTGKADGSLSAVTRRGDMVITVTGEKMAQEQLTRLSRLLADRATA